MSKNNAPVTVGEDGVIRLNVVGDVTRALAEQFMERIEEAADENRLRHKKVLILVDLTQAGTGASATHGMAKDFFKRVAYDRIAFFGANKGNAQILGYILNTVSSLLHVRSFKTEARATAWLKREPSLSKKRRALVFSLIFTALAAGWQWVVAPNLLRLPANFSYEASVVSHDDFYDEQKGGFSGQTVSDTRFSYAVTGSRNGVLDIKNIFDVRTTAGDKIFAVERTYGIDPSTRQHVPSNGDQPRTGYLFAPANLDKQDFVYWHINYNAPAIMKYQGEEDVLGLKTYRYKADYHADQTKELGNLPHVGETRGINVDISLQLWIEPSTGHLISYEDSSTAYYYNLQTGERLNPWNRFSNSYSFDSVVAQVRSAEQEKRRKEFVESTAPVLFAIVAFAFLVRWGFLYVRQQRVKNMPAQALAAANLKQGESNKVLFLALSVLGVMLLITWLSWQQATQNELKQANIQFQGSANDLHVIVTKELESYIKALEGARGLFAASNDVSRSEWKAYIDSLQLNQYYPGTLGVGFAQMLSPEQKAAHIKQVRNEGFPSYDIFPAGERNQYSTVTFIEPFTESNQRAFGYDMFADPIRREAMERARDTGEPAMSGKVSLVQETGADPQGVLIYLPIYQKNRPLTSPEERKAALIGFVYMPVRMTDFMLATLGNQTHGLNMSLFDTPTAADLTADTRLYVFNAQYGIENTSYAPSFLRTETATIAGRPLTFRYASLPSYRTSTSAQSLPNIILFSGVTLSLLLAALTYTLGSSRARALRLANAMTVDLRNERNAAVTTQHKDEAILRSIGDGVFVVDRSGVVRLFNKAAEAISGVGERQAIGRHYTETLAFQNSKTNTPVDDFITKALAGSPAQMARLTVLKRLDGKVVPVADSAAPIFNSRGTLEGAVVVFRDVSHERELERAKDEFLSMASHELRTPMGAVRANVAMMLGGDYGPVNKSLVEPLTDVHSSAVRLVELVNDLLDASRIEAGRMRFAVGEYDVRTLTKKIVSDIAPLGKERGLALRLAPGASAVVQTDPERFRQVVTNILGNALKFTNKGGITIDIGIQDHVAELSISDTGIGIPASLQSKLFAKFSQISSAQVGKPAGTGLGLYISREIMRKMGGELWLKHSEAGKGSVFALVVPLAGTPLARKVAAALEQESQEHADQK